MPASEGPGQLADRFPSPAFASALPISGMPASTVAVSPLRVPRHLVEGSGHPHAAGARDFLDEPRPLGWIETELAGAEPHGLLAELLTLWARASDRPVVLFLDEIDSLVGDTLVSVLRQLRSGYHKRPAGFPVSVVLCGVWDVRDYRIHASAEKEPITGGSCFNVKAESLRLGNFSGASHLTRCGPFRPEEDGQPAAPPNDRAPPSGAQDRAHLSRGSTTRRGRRCPGWVRS